MNNSKTVIGITTRVVKDNDYRIEVVGSTSAYTNAVLAVGAVPILIPLFERDDLSVAEHYAALCDALILTGGEDVSPDRYHEKPHAALGEVSEKRDAYEIEVFNAFRKKDKKILGVCRGLQLVNVALGGTLYQDLPSQYPDTAIAHTAKDDRWHELVHDVGVDDKSLLYSVLRGKNFPVNSIHHQSV